MALISNKTLVDTYEHTGSPYDWSGQIIAFALEDNIIYFNYRRVSNYYSAMYNIDSYIFTDNITIPSYISLHTSGPVRMPFIEDDSDTVIRYGDNILSIEIDSIGHQLNYAGSFPGSNGNYTTRISGYLAPFIFNKRKENDNALYIYSIGCGISNQKTIPDIEIENPHDSRIWTGTSIVETKVVNEIDITTFRPFCVPTSNIISAADEVF